MGLFDRLIRRKNQPVMVGGFQNNTFIAANGEKYVKHGFSENPHLYSVVSRIASKFSQATFKVVIGEDELDQHPIIELLRRPTPLMGGDRWLEMVDGLYELHGEVFIRKLWPDNGPGAGIPVELEIIPSPYIATIKYDITGQPAVYKFVQGVRRIDIPAAEIIHWKQFNPSGGDRGLSPVKAAAVVINQSNSAYVSNAKLLQNTGAQGVLGYKNSKDRQTLGKEQIEAVEEKYYEKYSGPGNRGRIMVTSGEWSWTSIGMSAVDLELIQSQQASLRDICNVYGVQSQLFNDPENKAYNNLIEGGKDFVRSCVVPRINSFISQLNVGLTRHYGDNVRVVFDKMSFHELQADFVGMASALGQMWWLKPNERRKVMGYEPDPNPDMDTIWIPSGLIPISD